MKKTNVTFLIDKKNNWILKYIDFKTFKNNQKYNFKVKSSSNFVRNQDIVFPINFTKILSDNFLQQNKLTLIVHSSNLPKNKGFAPMANQILEGKKEIVFTLIKAKKKVDSGDICFKTKIFLDGTELYDDLRKKQALEIKKIIKKFLKNFPKISFIKQKGLGSFNKRRTPNDSELNINKSIRSQFNLLRICDNEKFPSFFYYKKKKYILKIYKKNDINLNEKK